VTTNALSAAQIKRHIGDTLALAEAGGSLWAGNRYWLTRAEYIAPFLAEHSIEGPGVWQIVGREVWHDAASPPNVAPLLNLANYTVPLKDATIGDWGEIYTLSGHGQYSKLLTTSTGRKVMAVRADWLEWLECAPPGNRKHIYSMRLATTKQRIGPIAVIAHPLDPEPEDNVSPEIVAVLMPVRTHRPDELAAPVAG
jgi:hypothetical protein